MISQIEEWMLKGGARNLKLSGDNIVALCPFHRDSSRSFSMNRKTGFYLCFSESCGASGHLAQFLERACGYSRERANSAAEEYGTFSDGTGEWSELPDWSVRHKEVVDVSNAPHERMLGAYDFCPTYLLERGFTKRILRAWEVGYDQETERVTIPVRDVAGRLVGYSKRATLEFQEPRYLHLHFQKSHHIYGLYRTKKETELWVGEGQLDAIAMEQMGLGRNQGACSVMGSRVSNKQINLLVSHECVILAFDLDAAGMAATKDVGDKLLNQGTEVFIASSFPARECPDGKKWDPVALLSFGTDDEQRMFKEQIVPWSVLRLSEIFK